MATLTRYVNPDSTAGGDGTTNATSGANRAYVSLSAWEAAEQQNLDTGNNIAECICETNGTADATFVSIDGWTTSATDYIDIKTSAGHRHAGVWDAAKYNLTLSRNGGLIECAEEYARFTGLQINNTDGGTAGQNGIRGFPTGTSVWHISKCILRNGRYGHTSEGGAGRTTYMWNCLIYGGSSGALNCEGSSNLYVYSCTTYGGTDGFRNNAGGTMVAENCYARTYQAGWTLTTCAASDTTGTSAGLDNIAYNTTNFTNVTTGSEDLRLPSGSALVDVGQDTTGESDPLNFTDDITGTTRTGTWDVGAYEYVAGGGGTTITGLGRRFHGWTYRQGG